MNRKKSAGIFKYSSIFCALLGGILLASKISISGYGFIFLALSSGQLLIASIQITEKTTAIYAACVFIFVDCLGVYRWVLN